MSFSLRRLVSSPRSSRGYPWSLFFSNSIATSGPGHSKARMMSTKEEPIAIKKLGSMPSKIGQPTSYSHPHLIGPNEICIGVSKEEIMERRTRLMQSIQRFSLNLDPKLKRHTVIIPSANKKYMSDKIPYVFRQNSDFYYYTGCLEPESVLVLHIDEDGSVRTVLFMRPKDKHSELWDGVRTGPALAPEFFGCCESHSIDEFGKYLQQHLSHFANTTLWFDKQNQEQPLIAQVIQSNLDLSLNKTVESPLAFFHKMRVIKSPAELDLMRKTCDIASKAINDTIRETKPGDSEHLLFAKVDYLCRVQNAKQLAYPPVVASGRNATTIHYIDNSQIINEGDMVLMDAGCEYGGYSSDITRTWPISGQFTDAQLVLYEVTLRLQEDLIGVLTKNGGQTLDGLFDTMCHKLGTLLQEVGLVDKSISGLELARAGYSFCPHHVSHYLGMDVHDTPTYSRSNPLVSGMTFTVEPGIYISESRRSVPEEFRGLGIRIEDDCAILPDNSVEVLTRNCVKSVQDIAK